MSFCVIYVCLPILVSNIYCAFVVFFFVLCTLCCQCLCVFLRLVYSMLPVSLDCPFLIYPSVFSNIYLVLTISENKCIFFEFPLERNVVQ